MGERDQARRGAEWAGRIGYAAKGVVYVLVGILSLHAAMTGGDRAEGSDGALETLAAQPFGQVLLVVLGVGLLAYALWRGFQTIADPEHEGEDASGLAHRAGYLISGALYGLLGVEALRIALGGGGDGSGGDQQAEHWTATVMAAPAGRWLIALVGLGIIGYGLYSFYRATSEDLADKLALGERRGERREWAERIGRFGIGARGVVFLVIGGLLVAAAWNYDPDRAAGLGEALRTLERQPFGPWLLGLVAAGLFAFGVFQLIKARYRRIPA